MVRHWRQRHRDIATTLWPSFLVAAGATAVFFACVDPLLLVETLTVQYELDRTAVYTLGFFFFWAITATAAGLSTWLIRTERRRADFPDIDHESTSDQV